MTSPASDMRSRFHAPPKDVWFDIQTTVGAEVIAAGDGAGDSDATYTVTVGQVGRHLAMANVPILAVKWVIVGGGPVAGYTISQAAGTVFPVTPGMLDVNPLTFAWSAGPTCVVGVYIYTPYGYGYVQNKFNIVSPQINFFESLTQQVYVGPYAGGTYIRFGKPASPATPGIELNAVLFGAQSVAGTVGILQLAINERTVIHTDNRQWHWSLNGQAVLDVGPDAAYTFYQNVVDVLPVGANAHVEVSDSPSGQLGQPLKFRSIGDGNPVVPETYRSYLMFAPAGGIYVPLSVLTWTWEGYTELEDGIWGAVQDPGNLVNPSGVATAQFPVWTTNTAAGGWVLGAAARALAGSVG